MRPLAPLPSPLLTPLLHALGARGEATLPAAPGRSGAAIVRHLWVEAARHLGGPFPLVLLDGQRLVGLPDTALREQAEAAAGQADGGWLWVGRGAPAALGPAARAATAGRAGLLWEGEDPDAALSLAMEAAPIDAALAVERGADPALQVVLESAQAQLQASGLVVLVGPPGSRPERLAPALVGEPIVSAGGGRAVPSHRPALFAELGELPEDAVAELASRLRTEPPAAPPLFSAMRPRPDDPAFAPILGQSPALVGLLEAAAAAARSARPALLLGEAGTGKEGLARALHRASGRRGPFHAIDLGAIPAELLESELFGHARGAFSGADRARPGAWRAAEGGTLFLDELGNLDLRLQARLLRVLQEGAVRPVGEDRTISVDVRVIAATNADLEGRAARGEFREDLLFRLNTFTLRLPPLRERGDDILLLFREFLRRELGFVPTIEGSAAARLRRWPWPGNVRELDSLAALVTTRLSPGRALTEAELPEIDPARRRPGPTVVTWTEAPGERVSLPPALPRAAALRLQALRVPIPALRDRPRPALRALLRARLGDLPVTDAALDALVRRPWWGDEAELAAAVATLRAGCPGLLDLPDIRRLLPNPAGAAGIRVLLFPSVGPDGTLRGLREDHEAPALLLGRARELGAALRVAERLPGGAARLQAHGRPALQDLSLLPTLSRLHALLFTAEEGLAIELFPWVRQPVRVTSLRAESAPRLLRPGEVAPLGDAARIDLLGPDHQLLLTLWAFAGPVAWEDRSPHLLELLRSDEAAATKMSSPPRAPSPAALPIEPLAAPAAPSTSLTPVPGAPTEPRTHRWVLGEHEQDALITLMLAFPGGELKAWVFGEIAAWSGPQERLATYLRSAPKTADYIGRLFDFEPNDALRRRFAARLHGHPELEALIRRLPARLARLARELAEAG
jgi:transcriptional regulator with AAA-type ATPase domain